MALPVAVDNVMASTTSTTFLGTIFDRSIDSILWLFGTIWPYLITVAVLYIFWKIGRSFFRGR